MVLEEQYISVMGEGDSGSHEKQVVFSTSIKSLDFIPSATEALKSFKKGGEMCGLHF